MDTQAEAVASAPSPDAAALPTEEALSESTPPSSSPTKAPETQDLSVEDAVVLLHEEEMTDFPKVDVHPAPPLLRWSLVDVDAM